MQGDITPPNALKRRITSNFRYQQQEQFRRWFCQSLINELIFKGNVLTPVNVNKYNANQANLDITVLYS